MLAIATAAHRAGATGPVTVAARDKINDPIIRAEVLRTVATGLPAATVLASIGVSRVEIRRWQQMALDGVEPFACFASELEMATAQGARHLASLMLREANGRRDKNGIWRRDLKAITYLLERMAPELRVEAAPLVEVNVKSDKVSLARLTDAQLAALEFAMGPGTPPNAPGGVALASELHTEGEGAGAWVEAPEAPGEDPDA